MYSLGLSGRVAVKSGSGPGCCTMKEFITIIMIASMVKSTGTCLGGWGGGEITLDFK